MPKRKKPPELTFQQHIAKFLVREHQYGVLEQTDITDTEHCIAEDHLWAFLKVKATQADTLKQMGSKWGQKWGQANLKMKKNGVRLTLLLFCGFANRSIKFA